MIQDPVCGDFLRGLTVYPLCLRSSALFPMGAADAVFLLLVIRPWPTAPAHRSETAPFYAFPLLDVNSFPCRNLEYSRVVPSDSFPDSLRRKVFHRFWFYSPSEAFRSEIRHARCASLIVYSATASFRCLVFYYPLFSLFCFKQHGYLRRYRHLPDTRRSVERHVSKCSCFGVVLEDCCHIFTPRSVHLYGT